MALDLNFYKGKKVFITGHTGFKGTWLCGMLVNAGAIVTGYSLEPPTNPSLFEMAGLEDKMTSVIGDIRDLVHLQQVITLRKYSQNVKLSPLNHMNVQHSPMVV